MSRHPDEYWQLNDDLPAQSDPEQEAARRRCGVDHYVRGWVIIGQAPGQNGFTAEIEHSFAMDVSQERARLYRRRKDGLEDLTERDISSNLRSLSQSWPMPFRVFDIDDPACPIVLDWIHYEKASGDGSSRYKFEVRNLKFMVKE